MDLGKLLFSFVLLINSTTTTKAALSAVDIAQNQQINQILVELCASEIDRNKTALAILKLNQLPIATMAIKDVVKYHTENYEESFDNLLHFIDQISSANVQRTAYDTLIDAIESDKINFINVLSFHDFCRTKLEPATLFEKEMYSQFLSTTAKHIKKIIPTTNLKELPERIYNSMNPTRLLENIPTIVQGIDLNNFSDVNRIFEFSMQLPQVNRLQIMRGVLSEMRMKSQYKHVFHVVCQVNLLEESIVIGGQTDVELGSLVELTKEIPFQMRRLLRTENIWQIKSLTTDACLSCSASSRYHKNILFLDTLPYSWRIESQSYNSVMIRDFYNEYLSVEYSFHNDTFPTMRNRDKDDLTQINWYLLMGDDLSHVQIKNIHTNDLLVADGVCEMRNDGLRRPRVALSRKCADCDSSKWLLTLKMNKPL